MKPKTHSNFVRSIYFWIGIAATLAYRIVIVLNHISPTWVLASWYIGTVGFIIYFAHRYQISEFRANLIKINLLSEKINRDEQLSANDKEAIDYIFKTLQSSREKWNYIFIFVSSVLALMAGIYLDFIAR
ncbi:MAG: hypothetical protein Q8Q05_04040 [bacterium]|nr:hypothetical protein [bacterium]